MKEKIGPAGVATSAHGLMKQESASGCVVGQLPLQLKVKEGVI